MKKVLTTLSNKKAEEPFEVPYELIKHVGLEMQTIMRKIFDIILRTGVYPSIWLYLRIYPMAKSCL